MSEYTVKTFISKGFVKYKQMKLVIIRKNNAGFGDILTPLFSSNVKR